MGVAILLVVRILGEECSIGLAVPVIPAGDELLKEVTDCCFVVHL
jgi:hypothetical protein